MDRGLKRNSEESSEDGAGEPASDASPTAIPKPAPTKSCSYCRGTHLKCSGDTPCIQCKRRGQACVYPPPRKRGPKPGSNNQVRNQKRVISQLTEELAKAKRECTLWQLRYMEKPGSDDARAAVPSSPESPAEASSVLPTPSRASDKIYDPTVFSPYLEAFFECIRPFHPTVYAEVYTPASCASWFAACDRIQKSQLSLYVQLHTMCALGARKVGCVPHAEIYAARAEAMAKELFDNIDLETANTFSLLSLYSFVVNDLTRAVLYNGVAYAICEIKKEFDSDIARCVLLYGAIVCEHPQGRLYKLSRISREAPFDANLDGLMADLSRIQTEIQLNCKLEQPLVTAKLEEVDRIIMKLASSFPPFVVLTLQLVILGLRVGAYYSMGLKPNALESATRIAQLCRHQAFAHCFVVVVPALEAAAQILYDCGYVDLLGSIGTELRHLAGYPVAVLAMRKIEARIRSLSEQFVYPQAPLAAPSSVKAEMPREGTGYLALVDSCDMASLFNADHLHTVKPMTSEDWTSILQNSSSKTKLV